MAEFTNARFSGKLDSKGRITVPARLRDRMDLEEGDKISVSIQSCQIIQKKVENYGEALELAQQFESVKSFCFQEGIVEVILSDR